MKAICSWEIESNVAVKRPRVNVLKGNIAKEKESPVVLFIAERDRWDSDRSPDRDDSLCIVRCLGRNGESISC